MVKLDSICERISPRRKKQPCLNREQFQGNRLFLFSINRTETKDTCSMTSGAIQHGVPTNVCLARSRES